MDARGRIIAGDDGLCARKARNKERVWELLANAIARDLDRPPDALEPRMAAAATRRSSKRPTATGRRTRRPATWRLARRGLATLDRAVVFIAAGIRALRDADRGA